MDNHFIRGDESIYQKEVIQPLRKKRKIRLYPDKAQLDHKLFRIACQTFTIRGMGKLNRGPQFLRILWLFFIFIMTLGLIVATILIVLEYLQYDVSINISIMDQGPDPFPALTVCHQHPFSQRAHQLWNNGSIMSPTKFSSSLYKEANRYLTMPSPDVDLATSAFQSDMISIYYQNIAQKEAESIGFSSDIFLNCMYDGSQEIVFEENCSQLNAFRIKTLSHHTFFNCHTFEPKDAEGSTAINQLGLIVSLGPEPDYLKNEKGFLLDIFNMAKGLRVIVHPSGTFPNIEEESVNVEPGKLNEINFRHVRWENLDTPTRSCVHDDQTRFETDHDNLKKLNKEDDQLLYAYMDLDQSYTYTERQCNEYFTQANIIKKCKCQYIYFPRIKSPDEVPYCGNIDAEKNIANMTKFNDAIKCLGEIQFDKKFEQCRRLCKKSEYEWSTSVTKWRAVDWQLHWLIHLNSIFKEMGSIEKDKLINSTAYKKWNEFYSKKNLTDIPSKKARDLNLQGDNFAYVVLKRKQGGRVIKKEKLTLSIYVLFSRIGGLCSLTIGLTTAFFIEIIEFVYLIYYQKKKKYKNSPVNEDTKNLKKDSYPRVDEGYIL